MIAAAEQKKQRFAAFLLVLNVAMTLAKLIAAVLTASVGLLSEAIHSASDVFSSLLAYLGIRAAAAPPDEDHPYGHGKIESLAGFGESIMVFGIVAYVAIESVHRLITPQKVEQVSLGIIVMGISAGVAFLIGGISRKVAAETGSMALKSNSMHWMLDAVTSAAVLVGLIAYQITGLKMIDPILGLVLAVWMFFGAVKLSREAFHELIDVILPESEVELVKKLVCEEAGVLGYHRLRTRRSGTLRHIDLHLVVPREWSVVQAHDVADGLEKKIAAALSPAHVVIHVDPYDEGKALRG